MHDRYRLGGVADDRLLAALSGLVERENDLMSDLLAHLAELDERRLFLDLGFHPVVCHEARPSCSRTARRHSVYASRRPGGGSWRLAFVGGIRRSSNGSPA